MAASVAVNDVVQVRVLRRELDREERLMDDSTAMAFGRIERAVDKVEEKVDKVAEQIGELSLKVVAHGVRLDHVERDLKETQAELAADDGRKVSLKDKIFVAALTLLGSGAVSWVLAIVTK